MPLLLNIFITFFHITLFHYYYIDYYHLAIIDIDDIIDYAIISH